MQLKLNIYEKKEIVKTYTAETFDLSYGTIEDLISAVDLDKIDNAVEVGKMVVSILPQIKPILCEIFDGLTEAEIRKAHVKEIIPVFVEAFKYAFSELGKLGDGNEGN